MVRFNGHAVHGSGIGVSFNASDEYLQTKRTQCEQSCRQSEARSSKIEIKATLTSQVTVNTTQAPIVAHLDLDRLAVALPWPHTTWKDNFDILHMLHMDLLLQLLVVAHQVELLEERQADIRAEVVGGAAAVAVLRNGRHSRRVVHEPAIEHAK